MRQLLSSTRLFHRQFQQRFHSTGAILPSSRFAALEMTRYLRKRSPASDSSAGLRVLEVGPGTGSVTAEICRFMQPADTLDLVEINEHFVSHLQRRFEREHVFQGVANRAKIHCLPIEQLPQTDPYDIIISGLPLNNFAVDDVRRILQQFQDLMKPGAHCSFFEYVAIRRLKSLVTFPPPHERERLRGVAHAIREFLEQGVRRKAVWFNIPPAWVHHVQRPPADLVPALANGRNRHESVAKPG